jgi:hypothetical protein
MIDASQVVSSVRVGGLRPDDSAGRARIEFMAVTSRCGEQTVAYLVPVSCRPPWRKGLTVGTEQACGRHWWHCPRRARLGLHSAPGVVFPD